MVIQKPNYFIIGAPKCGTTAISEYLRMHPNIFITRPKEPHYFAEDFYRPISTLREYYALYERVSENHIAIGEGSVSYLASRVAIKNLIEFNPDAKFIVMVRNPIDMIPSLHSQLLATLYEDEQSFEKAWYLQNDRRAGRNIPKTCRSPIFLDYAYMGSLGSQLQRLFNLVERSNVKVVVFDDFVSSTKVVYEDILGFLQVPSDGRDEFPRINSNRVVRSNRITQIVQRPPKSITSAYRKIKSLLNLRDIGVLSGINRMNSKVVPRKSLNPQLKMTLTETFREDVNLLSELIERDLSHWLED